MKESLIKKLKNYICKNITEEFFKNDMKQKNIKNEKSPRPFKRSILSTLENKHVSAVDFKNYDLKKKIISEFANNGDTTITSLSNLLNLSTPKVTEIINELIAHEIVQDYGKLNTNGGRKPNVYGLNANAGFFLGIEVRNFYVSLGLLDFKKNLIKSAQDLPFTLANTPESLQSLCKIIEDFIKGLPVKKDKILGIGVNLSGRINYKTGYSYSYFHFSEDPLSKIIEDRIGIPTYLENDSRAAAYAEFCNGIVKDEKNVLFLNLDYGIGVGIMMNGQLYYGKSGFAGEIGHIPIFDNEIICHCGKKGCLETEASGWALLRLLTQKLKQGSSSILSRNNVSFENIKLEDVINAVSLDDVLAIELVATIGERLGRGIASLINIFNPELIILGGVLSATKDYIRLPIKSAINKYSLSLVNNDTDLKMSSLGNTAGIIGSCLLARNRFLS